MTRRKTIQITAPNLAAMKNKVKNMRGNYVIDHSYVISKNWIVYLKERKK